MNSILRNIFIVILLFTTFLVRSSEHVDQNVKTEGHNQNTEIDIKKIILHHVGDAYEWHITKIGTEDLSIPLPVILYSKISGWHLFLSSRLHEKSGYQGMSLAHEGKYEGKIVETNEAGQQIRPFDISLTKNAVSLIIAAILIIALFMSVAKSFKRNGYVPGSKFVVLMEILLTDIYENVVKSSLGDNYKKFAPYLITLFFYIFINNLIGIVPLFPGGANVTGNIAVTFVLAAVTFLIVNVKGSKEYWKEILWPDVPWWLKFPLPIMPLIELTGIFMKPFALMIRLFANILAGHSVILSLTCVIFVTVKMGFAVNSGMTLLAIVFSVFLGLIEFLVAYIQAYVFTLLTAIFISLARIEHKPLEHKPLEHK